MELEEILKMKFPHRDMQPNANLTEESINEERRMADLITKLVEKGLDTNILLHDSGFKNLCETIKETERYKIEEQLKSESKKRYNGFNEREQREYIESIKKEPIELDFAASESDTIGYKKIGEYNIPTIREEDTNISYSIGENGEFIVTYSYREQAGTKDEEDLSKKQDHINRNTKSIQVKNGKAVCSKKTHREDYIPNTGVRSIADFEESQIMDEFDTTLNYTKVSSSRKMDFNGNILSEDTPTVDSIERNQDGVTATQCLPDGSKRKFLLDNLEFISSLYVPENPIIDPTNEQIRETQRKLLNDMQRYGIGDYRTYEMFNSLGEKDRFGLAYALPTLKVLKTIRQNKELSYKETQPLEQNAESLETDDTPEKTQVDGRQKKIGDIKIAIQELIKDGVILEDLQKELDELDREGNIEEEQNIE